MITSIFLDFDINRKKHIGITATVKIVDKTDVEMEALTQLWFLHYILIYVNCR